MGKRDLPDIRICPSPKDEGPKALAYIYIYIYIYISQANPDCPCYD